MPHLSIIDDLKSKLLILSGLALSGEEFSMRYLMASKEYHKTYDLLDYSNLTQSLVSKYLIDIAQKTNTLVNSLQMNLEKHLSSLKITSYSSNMNSVSNITSQSINSVCKHVIRAKSLQLDFNELISLPDEIRWWTGDVIIAGDNQNNQWNLTFSLVDWCDHIMDFLKMTEHTIKNC